MSRIEKENPTRLEQMGNRLIPYLEDWLTFLAGPAAGFEPGEMAVVCQTSIEAKNGLSIVWLGVGLGVSEFGYCQPVLRFNRGVPGRSPAAEFFPESEPVKYRLTFFQSTFGWRFNQVERLVVNGEKHLWQRCDSDTSFVILTALGDLLPRLVQQGE